MAAEGKGAPGATPARRKATGWTMAKQRRFLIELGRTANVAAACRKVKMATSGVYELRSRSPGFRTAWHEALREGYAQLELTMLDQALHGRVKRIIHGGQETGRTHEYPDNITLTLFRRHCAAMDASATADAEDAAVPTDDVRVALLAELETIRAKLDGDADA